MRNNADKLERESGASPAVTEKEISKQTNGYEFVKDWYRMGKGGA